MRFRLKDAQLQSRLDAISDGHFSERLQQAVLSRYAQLFLAPKTGEMCNWPSVTVVFGPMTLDAFGDYACKYTATFANDEIEFEEVR